MNNDLVKYYKDRAKEYERIYSKPERQEELALSAGILKALFKDTAIIEVACGTGYWTEAIAQTATSVLATDINEEVLEIARHKRFPNANVRFAVDNIFEPADTKTHEGLFAGFIWSHVLLQDLPWFLKSLRARVKRGATIVIMDNNYVEGSNLPVTDTDNLGNTYQTRKLDDGSVHKVLKNFPTESFLKQQAGHFGDEINVTSLRYYWILQYKAK